MKSLSAKVIIKILELNGFVFLRQRNGSHVVYFNSASKATVIVAFHRKNELLKIGTFLAIVKQSKIPKEKFK